MTEKEKQLKSTTIHTIIKSLSPKRDVISPNKGHRIISRSVSPEAIDYVTSYLNAHLEAIIEAFEQSLTEINNNPNSYYKQYRYDLRVAKKGLEKVRGKIK